MEQLETLFLKEFNNQINREFYTSYLYYAISVHFDRCFMECFSKYLKHKASQELVLAQKMCDYLILKNETIELSRIEKPKIECEHITDIFLFIEHHEKLMCEKLKSLYMLAQNNETKEFLEEIFDIKKLELRNTVLIN